jgi:cytochrome c556
MTRALPKIWENWSGFEADAKMLSDNAAKLSAALAAGDMDAAKAQFAAVGKVCGTCHKDYRGDKVQ